MKKIMLLLFSSFIVSTVLLVRKLSTGKAVYDQYDELFIKYGKQYGVSPLDLKAIAKVESDIGQDRRVIENQLSGDGLSKGIMQIVPNRGSAKEIQLKGNPTKDQWNDPVWSIEAGARLLGYLIKKYPDKQKAIIAYNQGEKNTDNGKDYTKNYYSKYLSALDSIINSGSVHV